MDVEGILLLISFAAGALLLLASLFPSQVWQRVLTAASALCAIPPALLIAGNAGVAAALLCVSIVIANGYHLIRQLGDKQQFRLSAEEMMLFARLPGLTPGQFKSLLSISEWHTPQSSMMLTKTGENPAALYYVLEGTVEVNRDGTRFNIGPHAFIGELAFLRKKPATAITFANAGALVVSWPHQALRDMMAGNDGIRKVLDNLLSADLAEKIARSTPPVLQEQSA